MVALDLCIAYRFYAIEETQLAPEQAEETAASSTAFAMTLCFRLDPVDKKLSVLHVLHLVNFCF